MKTSLFYPQAKHGFTLVELLTVIAIIAVLAAILIPTTRMVITRAHTAKCANNLRQLYTATIAYAADNDQYMPVGYGNRIPGGSPTTWEVTMLVYSQLSDVRGKGSITLTRALQLAMQNMYREDSILVCPEDPDPTQLYPTNSKGNDYNGRSYAGSVDVIFSTRDEFLLDQTKVIYKRRIDDPRLKGSMLLYADVKNSGRPERYSNTWTTNRHGGTPSPTNNGDENPNGGNNMVFFDGHVETLRRDEIPTGSTSEESKRFWAPLWSAD